MQKTEKRNSRQRFSRREGKEERAAPPPCGEPAGFARKGSVGAGRWEEVEESLDAVRSLQMARSLGSR